MSHPKVVFVIKPPGYGVRCKVFDVGVRRFSLPSHELRRVGSARPRVACAISNFDPLRPLFSSHESEAAISGKHMHHTIEELPCY
ncbi:hypothetical protein HBH56_036250 [Parastagonospora nodorum]|uniref:Uncharacterized protein n=1 Tax=Phaeosphaeria nodorum (strain SN15 / ATCC MYA-4574 / FGSC 10173) TaxID=321614 RepID=A0A7U2F9C4_PHANO|nr:hypothetical protein HBH56_036250 [Parastagonospora nodorum]QRD00039.1 hypothetical protein JI435_414450 [Parastagonospora nodorum SN15]KAH3933850.1 hypothetical protein HBH54_063220 [Parastagonospora nodorum]KAH3980421.1 hypothetical protein HBH52_094050 [Parastagonospora nodorum]KAH4049623.1 hypothetical protein HBH49_135310 [Parastagonospora nodorum]